MLPPSADVGLSYRLTSVDPGMQTFGHINVTKIKQQKTPKSNILFCLFKSKPQ